MRSLYRLIICLNLLFCVGVSQAQDQMFEDGYIELPSHIRSEIDDDPNKIKMYFDFNCQYCKALHPFMLTWGASLPHGLKFEFVPVKVDDMLYLFNAAAFKFVFDSNIPEKDKLRFMEHMYQFSALTHTTQERARLIKEAMTDVRLDVKEFVRLTQSGFYDAYFNELEHEQSMLNLQATPSFLIGGRFLTHSGMIDGETEQFITLLNAITSLHIYSERDSQNGIKP